MREVDVVENPFIASQNLHGCPATQQAALVAGEAEVVDWAKHRDEFDAKVCECNHVVAKTHIVLQGVEQRLKEAQKVEMPFDDATLALLAQLQQSLAGTTVVD